MRLVCSIASPPICLNHFQSPRGRRRRAQGTSIERRHAIIYLLAALGFSNFAAAMPQRVTIIANVTQATALTKCFPAFIA
jgi:hypothetical protein